MNVPFFTILALLLLPRVALALDSDRYQPAKISSMLQSYDLKGSKMNLSGDVSIQQGTIKISADKVTIFKHPDTGKILRIVAHGSPATFSQLMESGETMYGESRHFEYRAETADLIMTDQAKLKLGEKNRIKANYISYNQVSQKLLAKGMKKGDRTSTVLYPTKKS
ncbi:lipopolysaccharide transport periplasmic protein LptA [Vibrio nigripulchritudo]|uniref:Lipopolysaccharide export system protein LptA n=1 Tax=Vibrio nigripulchritudo TaxID=28173 RepID=A0A9P1JLD5_9VIBR|nr:lipopolysaccharide transport periplasmic protein LptA [Vibrio nigripulchritudo]CBJ93091.1 Putative Lipopolysaccharide-assembly, LptA [Vibrio nigripulchritudo]